jgi:hypothetical protein
VSLVCPVALGLVDTTSGLEILSDNVSSLLVDFSVDIVLIEYPLF